MNRIVIVGGGVIGLFTAFYLQKNGAQVTVLDRGDLSDGCSFGNAGLIVPSHIIPMASPGMLKKGIQNLFNSKSPLAAKLLPNASLLNWYLKFVGTSNIKHVNRSIPQLRDLSLLSRELYINIKKSLELNFPMWEKGLLMLYRSHKTGEELLNEARIAREAGLAVSELSALEVKNLEPHSSPSVSGAVHYHSDLHLNPALLMKTLITHLENSGVSLIRNNAVIGIKTSGNKAVTLETDKGKLDFDQLIITAGMWSQKILEQLKSPIAVQPGKGYSFKVNTSLPIQFPALLSDANVAVTPLGNGLTQFGGGMEIGYADSQIRQERVNQIVKAVGEFYPAEKNLRIDIAKIWQGLRPCSFDGLPYIGRLKQYTNVLVGTGHSMMGVTLAPATGLLLSELVAEQKTSLDLGPFRLER